MRFASAFSFRRKSHRRFPPFSENISAEQLQLVPLHGILIQKYFVRFCDKELNQ